MKVHEIGEFGLIDRLAAALPAGLPPGVRVGIGDDCAVLAAPGGGELALTVDAAVEGVHFDRRWLTPADIGHRALAAAASDLAAAGATPLAAVVAVEIEPDEDAAFMEALYRGAGALATVLGFAIVGGNVARRGPGGRGLSLTTTLLGHTPGRVPGRTGARAGDAVYLTGLPGRSRAGLDLLRGGLAPLSGEEGAIEAFRRPVPRLAAGLLVAPVASALIDISDGLAADLGHIARRSGVAIIIEDALLPVAPEIASVARRAGADPLDWVLGGGEDYELAATGPDAALAAFIPPLAVSGLPFRRIGRVEAGSGVHRLLRDGRRVPADAGFRHF